MRASIRGVRQALLLAGLLATLTIAPAQQAAADVGEPVVINRYTCEQLGGGDPAQEAFHILYASPKKSVAGPGPGALILLGIDAVNPCPAPFFIFLSSADRPFVLIAVPSGTPFVSVTPSDLKAAGLFPFSMTGNGSGTGIAGQDLCTGFQVAPDYFLVAEGLIAAPCP
jgi:hypothetical protein